MRKLKVQMQITIDGFVARPDGTQDWMVTDGDTAGVDFATKIADDHGLILMGRKMSKDFLPYWEKVVDGGKNMDMYELATRMVDIPKIIFSKTLKSTKGRNTRVENGDLKTEIQKLKSQPGKDILVYGGATFVSNLIKEDLVDEFMFFVNPVAIGAGMSIFHDTRKMKLLNTTEFPSGEVLNHYQTVR